MSKILIFILFQISIILYAETKGKKKPKRIVEPILKEKKSASKLTQVESKSETGSESILENKEAAKEINSNETEIKPTEQESKSTEKKIEQEPTPAETKKETPEEKKEITNEPKKLSTEEKTEPKNTYVEKPNQTEIKMDLAEVKVGIFGFIKADFVHSDRAMLSFGRENLTAPNQAKRIVQNDDREPRSLFSMRETSIGFNPKFGKNLESVIQFDLMDINKGNGGPASNPRIVQAYIEYKFSSKLELFAGQKWDIFSPLYPDTYNIISGLLGSGNIGWFREQIGLKHSLTEKLNLRYSLGNPNININPNVQNNIERSKYPTFAFQFEYLPSDKTKIYVSGIYASLLHYDPNDGARYLNRNYDSFNINEKKVYLDSQGLSFGWLRKFTSNLELKSEFHFGKNMDNLSLLATSAARSFTVADRAIVTNTLPDGREFISNGDFAQVSGVSQRFSPIYNRTYIKSFSEVGIWFSLKWDVNEKYEAVFLAGQVITSGGSFASRTQIRNTNNNVSAFGSRGNDFAGNVGGLASQSGSPNIWGDSQMGSVYKNSTIGGSIARKFEGNFKLFVYYQFTETEYRDDPNVKGFGHYFYFPNNYSSSNIRPLADTIHYDAGNKPHTHLIRAGAMQTF